MARFDSLGLSLRLPHVAQVSWLYDPVEQEVTIRFDERTVKYDFGELDEVSLACAVTIHKVQGLEFPAVVIPIATQHYVLLQHNLIYTGITRGKRPGRADWAEEGTGHCGSE